MVDMKNDNNIIKIYTKSCYEEIFIFYNFILIFFFRSDYYYYLLFLNKY